MSSGQAPETVALHISSQLPVYVSPEDLRDHAQFGQLLEDLTHRLTPSGATRTSQAALTQASLALRHARQENLEAATVLRLIQDVLRGTAASSLQDQEACQQLLETLTLSGLLDQLRLVEGQGGSHRNQDSVLTVFGISEEDVLSERDQILIPENQVKQLRQAVEEQVRQEMIKIVSFIDPVGFVSYDPEEGARLVQELEEKKKRLSQEQTKVIQSGLHNDYLSQQVYDILSKYGQVLRKLVSKHRLSQHSAQHLHSIALKLTAHILKLKCIQLELLLETYNSKSIPALKALNSHLAKRRSQAERDLTRLNHSLSSYSDLDPKFQELLKEYAKLQEDIAYAKRSFEQAALE